MSLGNLKTGNISFRKCHCVKCGKPHEMEMGDAEVRDFISVAGSFAFHVSGRINLNCNDCQPFKYTDGPRKDL